MIFRCPGRSEIHNQHILRRKLHHLLEFVWKGLISIDLPSLVLCSPGTFPPSNLIPLQRNRLYLTSPPSGISSLIAVSALWFGCPPTPFAQPSAVSKVKCTPPPPPQFPSVSPSGWAEGRSHQRSIKVQWQELCCSNRVQCSVLFWKESGQEHGEAATRPTPPAERGHESLHLHSSSCKDLS